MRRLRRFLSLPAADKIFLLSCLCQLLAIRVGLGLFRYGRVSKSLRARLSSPGLSHSAGRVIWGVRAAARVLPGTKCLASAMTLHYLLARSGHDSVINIGVATDKQIDLDAHAWVVFRDTIVVGEAGAAEGRYTLLTQLRLDTA